MDIKIIINSLIIIFILHIIILNINYSYNIGNNIKNKEHYGNSNVDKEENKPENISENKSDKSMNFLKNNNSSDKEDEEFKKKLMKYIHIDEKEKVTEFEEKNLNKIMPSNTFLSDNNVPNFESNVANISKFYNINFDNLDEDQLKSTSLENLNLIREKTFQVKNENSNEPTKDTNHLGRKSVENPNNWNYKNELPMNGGSMNGISGFDSLESQFSSYTPNKLNIQQPDSSNFNNIPHNDLRKPIVYEN
jgi:hypothetical protein